MAELESTMQWKVDVTQFTSAMQEAKKALQATNSEFKISTSTMDKWGNNTAGLEAKVKQLGGQVEAETRILDIYTNAWEDAKKEFGETSPEAERLAKKVEDQQIKVNKTQVQLTKYNEKLNEMQKEQKESESASSKLNNTIEEQEKTLSSLKNQYKDAVLQYGKNSKEAKELAQQIKELSSELKENKQQMQNADKAADTFDQSLDDLDNSANKAANGGFTVLKGALANLVSQGINAAINGVKSLARETFNAGANFESSMSQVAAVSGASAEELEKLTEKAKEMGAKTKFSASESAEAFNYMAMAGWKTEDMLNGIEGIMNLAAASGADLATTSDIVTDALTAMGYSAGDAGKLADVMAAASSNANTNVEMMGATFQYAAPIIGALGYNMEDTAVAIGLMANAGIKGEKAGTALRSILTRLSVDTDGCTTNLKKLGVEVVNSDGSMRDLSDVIVDLREVFDGLSESEQTALAKNIAGQEAMSGLLAIVNAAPEDFEKLTKAVEHSSGAAQVMADTMNDNVSGAITLLKSKVEGIMIKVFEKASNSIRKSLRTVDKALDQVNWDAFAKTAGNAANKIAEFFAFVVKNAPKIVNFLKTIATAFVTYKAVSTITSVIGAFKNLFTIVQGGTSVITAFNTALGLNPYALVAAGLSLVGLAAYEMYKKQKEATEATWGLTEAQQENILAAENLKYATEDTAKAMAESSANVETEYNKINELKSKYNELIDSNGKVKEGYEERAEYILNELAEALGVEREKIDELIEANGKLGESYDELVLKRKAQAMLDASEADYNKALQEQTEAVEKRVTAYNDLVEAQGKYDDALAKGGDAYSTYQQLLKDGMGDTAHWYYLQNKSLIDAIETSKKSLDEVEKEYDDASKSWENSSNTIMRYNDLVEASTSGNSAKINDAMLKMQYGFIDAENGTRESLQRQVDNFQQMYDDWKAAADSGLEGVTQEQLNQLAELVELSKAELDKLPPEAKTAGENTGKQFADGINANDRIAKDAGTKLGGNAKQGAEEGSAGIGISGIKAGNEFVTGVETNTEDANAAGITLGSKLNEGAVSGSSPMNESGVKAGDDFVSGVNSKAEESNTAGLNVGSMANSGAVSGSAPMSDSGYKAGGLFVTGVNNQITNANTAGFNVGDNANTGAVTGSIPMLDTGTNAGTAFVTGVESKSEDANAAGGKLADEAVDGSDKEGGDNGGAYSSGSHFGEGFFNGIGSWISKVWNKAKELAQAAWNGLRAGQQEGSPSKLTTKSGIFFGQGYENGINSMIKPVTDAASNLASEAVSALSANLNNEMLAIGEDSGNSLIDGINSVIPNVSGSIANLKNNVASASSNLNGSVINNSGSVANGERVQNVTFNQYNNSPKALSRLEVYRQTNSLLFGAKVRLQNV